MTSENEELKKERSAYRDQYQQARDEMEYARGGLTDHKLLERIDVLTNEKSVLSKRLTEQINQLNTLSAAAEDFQAENRQLRKMAGVPDNYGIDLNKIKLHDKDKIEDYKSLIKVLQDDNYNLEKERANLKHHIKQQCMIYNKEYQSDQKYKELTPD